MNKTGIAGWITFRTGVSRASYGGVMKSLLTGSLCLIKRRRPKVKRSSVYFKSGSDILLFLLQELWVVGTDEANANEQVGAVLEKNGYALDTSYTLVKVSRQICPPLF
jgi:hypothetical protein